jgi:hypothetical protein
MTTTTITPQTGKSVYEIGLNELHNVSSDEASHKRIEQEFREARGREGARLHVTLRAVSEADARNGENTRNVLQAISTLTADLQQKTDQLTHLIQSFENETNKQISGFWQAETEHFNTLRSQVSAFQQSTTNQVDTAYTHLSSQGRESTERLAVDVRKLRDEVVSLVDSRLNQADASFAALRGDVEVVKFLVMDLIKDRIGRTDPKQKPF